jgi:hypothetical protein
MAPKVFLRSIDQRTIDKVKRSRAESLVGQLLAIKLSPFEYQRVRIRPADEIESSPNSYIPFGLEPLIDDQIGVFSQIPALPGQIRFRAVKAVQF